MKYMGSKNRIAKYIVPIMLENRKEGQFFVEPFCGGCNITDKIENPRIASDKNKYLIAMWKGLQLGFGRPMKISFDLYSEARTEYNNKTNLCFLDWQIGWIGWMASYNGRFFDGGYSGNYKKRDYVDEQMRNTLKQVPLLDDVKFVHSSYEDLEIPTNSIIYCDIPYKGTKQYAVSKDFDYEKFWNWCRTKRKQGHLIFVSEYNAPEDFICVWEKEVTNSMNTTKTTRPTEKLFILK